MIVKSSVEIEAPAAAVWDVYTDVERWSEWTASIERVVALDGPGIEVGKRFEIKQPRLPKVVWEVTSVEPGVAWTWRQKSPGATSVADHRVVDGGTGQTVVHQRIDQHGPVGALIGRLMLRTTKRYLELEGQGLKARVAEQLRRRDASPA
jgi:uncharacterized membrane protein